MTTAFVFPGQGPQEAAMLAGVETSDRYRLLCDVLGEDPIQRIEKDPSYLNQNEIASTVTVLCSALELDRLRGLGIACASAAGYSVGQWTAMYAAGMLSFEDTLRLVLARAKLMNASDATKDGAMLAVIGLPTDKVEAICAAINGSRSGEALPPVSARSARCALRLPDEDFVAISNYNCLGQLTLAGTKRGIERAQQALQAEQPRKLAIVGTSGAWHCRLLDAAADQLGALLEKIPLQEPAFPIADNVTGDFLPKDRDTLLRTLTLQLCSPVRWEACIKRLAAERYVEVGHGEMLTKFGFFIDRKKQHLPSKKASRTEVIPRSQDGESGKVS